MPGIVVSQLFIFPAKSMRHVELDVCEVDRFGLHNDRRWMLVDSQGVYMTQRTYPRMCLIAATFNDASELILQVTGRPRIRVSDATGGKQVTVKVWDDQCTVNDCGNDVAQWLSTFLGVDCRLVYFPEYENRLLDQQYARPDEYTAFSDGFPILLLSQASLDDLNGRLASPVPVTRFRPNIVVSGCEAFAEDEWKQIRIGELILRVVKPCSRCSIPGIDTRTAEKDSSPIKALAQYRMRDNKIFFGQNAIANSIGRVKVGASVEVLL